MPFGKWATVQEASQHYGVTRQRIHQLMRRGALGRCRKFDGPGGVAWLIPYPFQRIQVAAPGRPKRKEEREQ